MKKVKAALLSALCLATFGTASAQSFEESLSTSFAKFDTATVIATMMPTASQLDMITLKYPDQWQSQFYSAYAHIKLSYKLADKNQRDQYLDGADAAIGKAEKLSPNNQEIFILQAYAAKARMAVDPKDRWKKYGDAYDDAIVKARKINPENPRIYLLEGEGPFFKPKIWGGGKDKAKPYFQKAKALFAKEDKTNILKPFWGQQANEDFLQQCDE
jgi:hypothetical protein